MTCMCAYANMHVSVHVFVRVWVNMLIKNFCNMNSMFMSDFFNLLLPRSYFFLRFCFVDLNSWRNYYKKLEIGNKQLKFSQMNQSGWTVPHCTFKVFKYESHRRLCLPHGRLEGTLDA